MTENTKAEWKSLYCAGAIAAILAAVLFRRNIGAEVSLFTGMESIPRSTADWFSLLQSNLIVEPQSTWLIAALLMLIPILMIFLILVLPQPANRWANLLVAGFFIPFNLVGLPTYPSLYDKSLLAVSMIFNGVTIWYAWQWA